MSNANELADRYIDAWNETDALLRRELVARVFAEGAAYRDPVMAAEGRESIASMIAGAQTRFPGCRFARAGEADGHDGALRFAWALQAPDASVVARGTDFAVLDGDGRMRAVTGFLDYVAS